MELPGKPQTLKTLHEEAGRGARAVRARLAEVEERRRRNWQRMDNFDAWMAREAEQRATATGPFVPRPAASDVDELALDPAGEVAPADDERSALSAD